MKKMSKPRIMAAQMAIVIWTMLVLVAANPAFAQRNKGNTQQSLDWAKGIIVDGYLGDWGDSLQYEHATQQFHYHIKNDAENVYVAMRVPEDRKSTRLNSSHVKISYAV